VQIQEFLLSGRMNLKTNVKFYYQPSITRNFVEVNICDASFHRDTNTLRIFLNRKEKNHE